MTAPYCLVTWGDADDTWHASSLGLEGPGANDHHDYIDPVSDRDTDREANRYCAAEEVA